MAGAALSPGLSVCCPCVTRVAAGYLVFWQRAEAGLGVGGGLSEEVVLLGLGCRPGASVVCVPGLGLQLLGVRWLLLLGLAGAAWLGDGRTESQG